MAGCNILRCSCGSKYFPQRFIMALLALTGILVGYGHRVSLNIAITAMTDKKLSKSTSCPPRNTSLIKGSKNISGGVINWSNSEQNLILASFYPGYIIGHIPAGVWCDQQGARWFFFIGMVLSTVVTMLTPLTVVYTPWWCTIIMRNLMGLGQSVLYPAISCLFAKWIPKEERSTWGAFSFAANSLGVICGSLFTGMLIRLVNHWHIGFYFWGVQGIIWCLLFITYVYSEPDKHPFITPKEKVLLDAKMKKTDKKPKIPWGAFCKDTSVWALIIAQIGNGFTVFTLVNNFPKYLSDVLHYNLAENAMASSLPYSLQWIGGVIAGKVIDALITKKKATVVTCRKVATTIGVVVPATFIVLAGYLGCDGTLVIIMFSLNLLFKGLIYPAMRINHLDMTINFAGIIMAFTNGIGAISGAISPPIINAMAPNNTIEEWQMVFWVVWIFGFVTNIYYLIFAVGERRKWDYGEDEIDVYNKREEEKKAEKQKKKDEKVAKKAQKKKGEDAGPSS